MTKLTKRLAKLIYWLDSSPIHGYGTTAVRYELYVIAGLDDKEDRPVRLTYSDTERNDMVEALNWLLEFRLSGPMDNLQVATLNRYRDEWRDRYYCYCSAWEEAHQNEIDAWNQQSEQVYRNGVTEYSQILGRPDNGPVETSYDRLRKWADSQAFKLPPDFYRVTIEAHDLSRERLMRLIEKSSTFKALGVF